MDCDYSDLKPENILFDMDGHVLLGALFFIHSYVVVEGQC